MSKQIILIAVIAAAAGLYLYYMINKTQQTNEQVSEETSTLNNDYNNDYFVKSPNEDRIHYSYILDNGLQILLISDPDIKKSAASLDLNIGSGNNPPERLGMAHYLEHMLFLGTEKFPQADGFQEFIGAHGGSYNAYTAYQNTNYFFDVQNDYFEEAMDRFADFFIAPVFPPEFAERERNVVDSEFHTGLKDDGRRYYAVFQELLNPLHPMAKFSVGNKDTLAGSADELISDLREFYGKYYRPSLMKLTVYSPLETDDLKALAEKYFGKLEPLPPAIPPIDEPIILPENLPMLAQFQPVKEARYLDYYFPIAAQTENFRSKPARFISYLLNGENSGGLEDLLKRKGWINGLHANLDVSLPEGAIYNIHFSVTPTGSKHIKEITGMMFRALEQMKEHVSDRWRYDEIAAATITHYNFRQERDPLGYVRSLSRTMQLLPPKRWLSNELWDEYNKEKLDEILQDLNPENMLIVWVAPEAGNSGKQETYYKVDYSAQKLSPQELQEFTSAAPSNIEMPPVNPFISSQVKLIEGKDTPPQKLDNELVAGWYKFNDSFNSPRVNLHISIESLNGALTPKDRIYDSLMVNLLNDKLNQEAYQGGLAGYHSDLGTAHYGIHISISGYNEKIDLWADENMALINNAKFKQEDFDRILDNLKRGIRNKAKDRPTGVVSKIFSNFMTKYNFADEDYLQELEQVTLEDIHQWRDKFFDKTRVMVLVYGNIKKQPAQKLADKFSAWNSEPLTDLVIPDRFLDISNQGRLIAQKANQQGDSAVLLYYQAEGIDYRTRVATSLLSRILHPQFFLKLRTEQELGYIVSAYYKKDHRKPGIAFSVQSNNKHSFGLVERIDAFIDAVPDFIGGLSPKEFGEYQDGLLNLLEKPPQNYGEDLGLYRYQIAEGVYSFDDRQRAIEELRKLTKEDLIKYSQSLLRKENSFVMLSDDSIKPEVPQPQGKLINDMQEFKRYLNKL